MEIIVAHLMNKQAAWVMVCAIAFAVIGCGDGSDKSAGSAPAPQAESSGAGMAMAASVSVSADKTHAVQPLDEITLTVTTSGFTLSESAIGEPNEPDTGHYRVYLDSASGDDYLLESAAAVSKVTVPESITDGSHDLRVVLYSNDKNQLAPAVETSALLIVYRL